MATNAQQKTNRWISRLLLLAITGGGCGAEPPVGEEDLAASSGFKAQIKKGELIITGNGASAHVTLRLQTSTLLDVDVGDDGSADFSFDRSRFERIVIDAGGGDDVVTMDESRGPFTQEERVTILGGNGDDTLRGGIGDEQFFGGAGNDTIVGSAGSDAASLGAGDDTFIWNPGDGSDVVEGEGGADLLVFAGSGAAERIDLGASGDRLLLVRDVGGITMDVAGVERVDVRPRGGADRVVVADLAGGAVSRVNVDLAAAADATVGDAEPDVVLVDGVPEGGTITAEAVDGAVVARGLAAEVRVAGGDPELDRLSVSGGALLTVNGTTGADAMSLVASEGGVAVVVGGFNVLVEALGTAALAVDGLGGDDTIGVAHALAPIPLRLAGGDGDDVITGGDGPDALSGGAGNDTIDGGFGVDTAFLGEGDDTFIWSPGGGSDVVEGEDGTDVMRFIGAPAAEKMDIRANGGRVAFLRDVGGIAMDLDGIESVEALVRGGADSVTVDDLAGTAVALVDVDLALNPGETTGDGLADTVLVLAPPDAGAIDVAADGAAVAARGLAAEVRIRNGEPGLDALSVNSGNPVNVNGSAAGDLIAVLSSGDEIAVQASGFNVFVKAIGTGTLAVNGLGGDDHIDATTALAPMPLELSGGDGDDVIVGGRGAELLFGGPGNDTIDGHLGADTAFLGAGDDTFIWNPGGGNDGVEGEDGTDLLVFNGAGGSEEMDLAANGNRLRFFRDLGGIVMDVDGVEGVDLNVLGGADRVVVNDLTGTSVARVRVDLAATLGGTTGDGQEDVVTVRGSAAADAIDITAGGRTAFVAGLAAEVRVTQPETSDRLVVNGLGGLDTIAVGPGVDALLLLTIAQD